MSTNDRQEIKQSRSDISDPRLIESAEANRPLHGAAAAQADFDYQLDVSMRPKAASRSHRCLLTTAGDTAQE